jgi:hypothetical protein
MFIRILNYMYQSSREYWFFYGPVQLARVCCVFCLFFPSLILTWVRIQLWKNIEKLTKTCMVEGTDAF